MSASIPSPDGAVDNDRHHHHDHHTVEVAGEAVVVDDVSGEPSPTPDADPVAVIEAALVRLVDDVGVLAEDDVVRAFSILKATNLPSYLRLRHAAKKTNRECSVTVLDKLVSAELPASDDDASALDELVALARTQCQLHHDADRNAMAVIPMPGRREVWRVYSSGFEQWLRAAYWRAKEMGVPEATMKSALATLAAAGINDGEEIEIHVRAARCDDGYLIVLADEQWQAIHVTPQGWRVVNESPGKVASQIDQPLLVALTRAFYWQQLLDDGVVGSGSDIAKAEGLHHSTVNELLRLTLLEPAIIQSILAGRQPRCMSLLWFQRNPLPTDWVAQREVVAGFDA